MADNRPKGRHGRAMAPVEKPKDFKGSMKNLIRYIGKYKIAVIIVMVCAAASTIFAVIGPKILGKATTALAEGLMKKIQGTGTLATTKAFEKLSVIAHGKRRCLLSMEWATCPIVSTTLI